MNADEYATLKDLADSLRHVNNAIRLIRVPVVIDALDTMVKNSRRRNMRENEFVVGVTGDGRIEIMSPPKEPITKEQAIDLAVLLLNLARGS